MDSEDSREDCKEVSSGPPSPRVEVQDSSDSSSGEFPVRKAEESRDGWSESRSGKESPSPSPGSTHSDSLPREAVRPARHRRRSPFNGGSPERNVPHKDPTTEEISDGEMESDHEVGTSNKHTVSSPSDENVTENNAKIDHEDLSDVSDLDSVGPASEDEQNKRTKKSPIRAPEQYDSVPSEIKINGDSSTKQSPQSSNNINENSNSESAKPETSLVEKINKMEEAEEQLDFEAEEGECIETPSPKKGNVNVDDNKGSDKKKDDDEASGAASSLEEGEITDDDERRPEETEPRPVCRFYSRGQCTWGISCRFLHPGVTDKGNYTMFDMVRSMPAGYNHHPGIPPHHGNPHGIMHPPSHLLYPPAAGLDIVPSESAWERGLRTAKEMMLKANKRREQEPDFEEKKMYLTGGSGARGGSIGPMDEDDLDLAAYAGYPAPLSPPVVKREYDEYYRQTEKRNVYEDVTFSSRSKIRYRGTSVEKHSPTHHRSAYYFEEKIDDKLRGSKSRKARTTREVIVQKVSGDTKKSDEWADPWMRSGGASRRSRERREKLKESHAGSRSKKYSSGSSYSTSSSSRSSSRSSSSKQSDSRVKKIRRHGLHSPHKQRSAISPSKIVQERKAANARAQAMNPPPPTRKRPPSPAAARQYASNPPAPNSKSGVDAFGRAKELKKNQGNKKRYSSSSGSDSSSSSSGSESGSRSSSSSKSSTDKRPTARGPPPPYKASVPADKKPVSNKISKPPSPKSGVIQKKDIVTDEARKELNKKRVAVSPPITAAPAKKPVSRREELLKQLKAVEEAIARKRSKI